jgi:hypothetical protein
VVAHSDTNNTGVQFISSRQKTCEKGGSILLAVTGDMHSRTSHLHQVWKWIVPNRNAIVGSDTMGKCGTWTCGLLAVLDMEDPEDPRAKETLSASLLLQQRRERNRGETVKCHCGFFL